MPTQREVGGRNACSASVSGRRMSVEVESRNNKSSPPAPSPMVSGQSYVCGCCKRGGARALLSKSGLRIHNRVGRQRSVLTAESAGVRWVLAGHVGRVEDGSAQARVEKTNETAGSRPLAFEVVVNENLRQVVVEPRGRTRGRTRGRCRGITSTGAMFGLQHMLGPGKGGLSLGLSYLIDH